jgi:hypothetical protein
VYLGSRCAGNAKSVAVLTVLNFKLLLTYSELFSNRKFFRLFMHRTIKMQADMSLRILNLDIKVTFTALSLYCPWCAIEWNLGGLQSWSGCGGGGKIPSPSGKQSLVLQYVDSTDLLSCYGSGLLIIVLSDCIKRFQ